MGKLLKKGIDYGGSGDGNWLIQDVNLDTKKEWLVPIQPTNPPSPTAIVDEYELPYNTGVNGGYYLSLDKKYDLQSVDDFMDESKIKLEVFYTGGGTGNNQWVEVSGWYTTIGNGRAANSVDPNIDIGFWFDMDDVVNYSTYIQFNDVEAKHRSNHSGSSGYDGMSKIRITYKNAKLPSQNQAVLQPTEIEVERKITRGSDLVKQELNEYLFTGLNPADMDYFWNTTLPGQINPDNILYDLRRVSTGELQVCQNEIVIGKVMRPNNEMSDAKRCIVVISGVANNMTYYTDLPFKNQVYRVLNMSGALHKYGDDGTTFVSYPLPYYRNNFGEELKAYITNSNGAPGVLGFKVGADIINNESTFGILTIDYYTF